MSEPLPLGEGPAPEALAIVGPTASGKTALSIEVALRLGGEVISMDSRQVYRQMDIGTAKASASQRALVPHHGLDLVEPDERFSAGRFARMAREVVRDVHARGRVPILVGGTGFFLRSLTHPIFREPDLDPERRARLQAYLDGLEPGTLHAWLRRLDPVTAQRLQSWGGQQRLLRALELPLLTGRPLSWWQRVAPPEAPPLHPLTVVLDMPRERLYQAINRRVDDMVTEGLIEEVRDLLERGYTEKDPGMNATGYIELIPAIRGLIPMEEALEQVRRNTRAYARRQLTWFRHQLPRDAVWLDATRPHPELAEEVVERWRAARSGGAGHQEGEARQ